MPRKARLDAPGTLHHIMVRGIEKKAIFRDAQDRSKFLERLGKIVVEAQCSIYAWVLMDNHVHMLFKSGREGISAVMRKLLTWYAQWFNGRHGRRGHLFENRYKSIICDEETYLLALVRYIHLNPVRAAIITTMNDLDRYPWSGHSAIIGEGECAWMNTEYVLRQFGQGGNASRRAYRRFVEEGMAMGHSDELTGGGLVRSLGGWSQVAASRRKGEAQRSDDRILGGAEFLNTVLKDADDKVIRQMKTRLSGLTIEGIIGEECGKSGIGEGELKGGSRRNEVSHVRAVIATRCVEELGLAAAEIARHLGVNTSSITRAVERHRARHRYAT